MTNPNMRCAHCGTSFASNHGNRKYCARTCSQRAYHQRRQTEGRSLNRTVHELVCQTCGTTWHTEKRTARFCSVDCIAAHRFGPARQRGRAPMSEHVKRSRRQLCKAARGTTGKGIVWTQGPCGWCRQPFLARTAAGAPARYCSKRCGGRAVKARHTQRKRDSYVEDVVPMLIFQRDDYRCHICRRKTLPNKKVPHPRAPTIDHMIPLSLGGPHSRANVSTACFRCNTLKSASGAGDQLAIIG